MTDRQNLLLKEFCLKFDRKRVFALIGKKSSYQWIYLSMNGQLFSVYNNWKQFQNGSLDNIFFRPFCPFVFLFIFLSPLLCLFVVFRTPPWRMYCFIIRTKRMNLDQMQPWSCMTQRVVNFVVWSIHFLLLCPMRLRFICHFNSLRGKLYLISGYVQWGR